MFDWFDFSYSLFWVFLFVLYGFISQQTTPNPDKKKYYLLGLIAKLVGGYAFAFVYIFYYGYGDTFGYFNGATILNEVFREDAEAAWKIFFNFSNTFDSDTYLYMKRFSRLRHVDTFTVIKFGSLFGLFARDNFLTLTIFFSFFAFLGQWKLFLFFRKRLPTTVSPGQIAFAALFIPSVTFWASGIMKDSLVMGFLGFFVYYMDRLFSLETKKFQPLLLASVSAFFIFLIKPYVIMALLPAYLLYAFLSSRDRIHNPILRFFIGPTIIFFGFLVAIGSVILLSGYSEKYQLENLLSSAKIYQKYHSEGEEGSGRNSSYTLTYSDNVVGILAVIPQAINVTLFRPYPWEVRSAGMVFSAVESLVFLVLVLRLIFRTPWTRYLRHFLSDSFVVFCLVFTLVFAFAVGFSSYNFGALVRYKTPCLPFFSVLLFHAFALSKEAKSFYQYQQRKFAKAA